MATATVRPAARAAATFLLLMLIESVMIDAMNFRGLWIAAAIVMAASEMDGLSD